MTTINTAPAVLFTASVANSFQSYTTLPGLIVYIRYCSVRQSTTIAVKSVNVGLSNVVINNVSQKVQLAVVLTNYSRKYNFV